MSVYRILCLFAMAVLVVQAWGQTPAGRITGVITDSSGAVVSGARVVARNNETGIEHAVVSNTEGNYLLYPLAPGIYTVSAESAGFRTGRLDDLRVDIAAVLTRNVRLEVAALQQQPVVVSAAGVPMLTQSVSVESTVIREQIKSLPLNARDFNQLVLLTAGVVENSYPTSGFGSVAANGNRTFSNEYALDGTPNNNVFQGLSAAAVSVDVIREFKVISGVAPAEYGQGGTQVAIATRSGSNRFHGSVFEYHRGTTWQAGNPFDPGAAQPFSRNQFGGSLGGPVRRDKLFFFFNYEARRQNQSVTRVLTVAPDAYWQGDFSSLLSRNVLLRDSLATGRPVFPGNIIPAARIDPTALKLREYWASPNRPGLTSNLVQNAKSPDTADQFTIRTDQSLPRSQSLMVRYTQTPTSTFVPSAYTSGAGVGLRRPYNNYNASIGWTVPVGPRTVNELQAGYAQFRARAIYVPGALPTTQSLGMVGFGPLIPAFSRSRSSTSPAPTRSRN